MKIQYVLLANCSVVVLHVTEYFSLHVEKPGFVLGVTKGYLSRLLPVSPWLLPLSFYIIELQKEMCEWITLPRMAGNFLTIIMFIALFRNENFLHRCPVCWKNNIQGVMEWHQLRTSLPAITRGKNEEFFRNLIFRKLFQGNFWNWYFFGTNFNAHFNMNMYVILSSTCFESALNRCSVQLPSRARIPDAVFVQLFLLKMGMSRPETCRG